MIASTARQFNRSTTKHMNTAQYPPRKNYYQSVRIPQHVEEMLADYRHRMRKQQHKDAWPKAMTLAAAAMLAASAALFLAMLMSQ